MPRSTFAASRSDMGCFIKCLANTSSSAQASSHLCGYSVRHVCVVFTRLHSGSVPKLWWNTVDLKLLGRRGERDKVGPVHLGVRFAREWSWRFRRPQSTQLHMLAEAIVPTSVVHKCTEETSSRTSSYYPPIFQFEPYRTKVTYSRGPFDGFMIAGVMLPRPRFTYKALTFLR